MLDISTLTENTMIRFYRNDVGMLEGRIVDQDGYTFWVLGDADLEYEVDFDDIDSVIA